MQRLHLVANEWQQSRAHATRKDGWKPIVKHEKEMPRWFFAWDMRGAARETPTLTNQWWRTPIEKLSIRHVQEQTPLVNTTWEQHVLPKKKKKTQLETYCRRMLSNHSTVQAIQSAVIFVDQARRVLIDAPESAYRCIIAIIQSKLRPSRLRHTDVPLLVTGFASRYASKVPQVDSIQQTEQNVQNMQYATIADVTTLNRNWDVNRSCWFCTKMWV